MYQFINISFRTYSLTRVWNITVLRKVFLIKQPEPQICFNKPQPFVSNFFGFRFHFHFQSQAPPEKAVCFKKFKERLFAIRNKFSLNMLSIIKSNQIQHKLLCTAKGNFFTTNSVEQGKMENIKHKIFSKGF